MPGMNRPQVRLGVVVHEASCSAFNYILHVPELDPSIPNLCRMTYHLSILARLGHRIRSCLQTAPQSIGQLWSATKSRATATAQALPSAFAERLGRLVHSPFDGGHALVGTAVLAGEELAEFARDDVIGYFHPGRQLGLRAHSIVDG